MHTDTNPLPSISTEQCETNTPAPAFPTTEPFLHLLSLRRERADCGHETTLPYFRDTISFCATCWERIHCRAMGCDNPATEQDAAGYLWCTYHQRGAILMTLGYELDFPEIRYGPTDLFLIFAGEAGWLEATRAACRSPQYLTKAVWAALALKLPGHSASIEKRER